MALDYRSMRDATQMATAMELAKAQNIGQAAASLGHAGGLGWEDRQGLMDFLKQRGYDRQYRRDKPKYDAIYQQGLKDNPWLTQDVDDFGMK